MSSTGLYCRSCCSVPTSALLQAQYLVIPIGMTRTYLDFLGFQTPCLAIFAICDCDAFYLCAQDRVVRRTFLSASRFYRSAIVKCYVEDFRCRSAAHCLIFPFQGAPKDCCTTTTTFVSAPAFCGLRPVGFGRVLKFPSCTGVTAHRCLLERPGRASTAHRSFRIDLTLSWRRLLLLLLLLLSSSNLAQAPSAFHRLTG